MENNKSDKKKKALSFVESVANNEQYQPVSLDELEESSSSEETKEVDRKEAELTVAAKEESGVVEARSESKGDITANGHNKQKGKKKVHDILRKKPDGPIKAIPIPVSIHSKIASLSNITAFGISDIASSVLLEFFETHKSEILKMLQRETLKEWK